MTINTFEVNRNRIIVNGTKIMWASIADIMPFGDENTSLQDKFVLFCNNRSNKVYNDETQNIKSENKTVKTNSIIINKDSEENSYTTKQSRWATPAKELTIEEIIDGFEDTISELTDYIDRQYGKLLLADKNDIRQEIIMELLNYSGKLLERSDSTDSRKVYYSRITSRNIDSHKYLFKERALKVIINRLSKEYRFNEYQRTIKDVEGFDTQCMNIYDEDLINNEESLISDIDELYNNVERHEVFSILSNVLTTLNDQEQRVIAMRFGLDGDGAKTLEEVGYKLGVNRERVRQIEVRALRRLRHPSRSYKICGLLGTGCNEYDNLYNRKYGNKNKNEETQPKSYNTESDIARYSDRMKEKKARLRKKALIQERLEQKKQARQEKINKRAEELSKQKEELEFEALKEEAERLINEEEEIERKQKYLKWMQEEEIDNTDYSYWRMSTEESFKVISVINKDKSEKILAFNIEDSRGKACAVDTKSLKKLIKNNQITNASFDDNKNLILEGEVKTLEQYYTDKIYIRLLV